MPNDLAISSTCTTVGKRGGIAIFWLPNSYVQFLIAASIRKSTPTEQTASHCKRKRFAGFFHIGRSKIAAFGRRRINVDCCADDTAE
jgi:hypothetical protein